MVAVPHHLDVVDLAQRHVDGQRVAERRGGVVGIDGGVEGMHVAQERALRVAQVGDVGVGGHEARHRGVRLARVVRQQVVVAQPEQRRVAPEAGVELLPMHEKEERRRHRVGRRPEGGDVGDALLLVDDQVLDEVEAFGHGLEGQVRRRVAVVTAVVHVHVQVAAPPAPRGQVVEPAQRQAQRPRLLRREAQLLPGRRVLGPAPGLDGHASGRYGDRGATAGVEVALLESLLAADEGLVGVAPRVVGGEAAAVSGGDGEPRRDRKAGGGIDDRDLDASGGLAVAAHARPHLLPLPARYVDHDERGVAVLVGDGGDAPPVARPARPGEIVFAEGQG